VACEDLAVQTHGYLEFTLKGEVEKIFQNAVAAWGYNESVADYLKSNPGARLRAIVKDWIENPLMNIVRLRDVQKS
jgi:hypothetical protein